MRIFKTIIAALAVGAVLTGCSKNDYPVFDTQYSALNIWIGTETAVQDSITYNYSYALGEKDVQFHARVIGTAADHDRSFTLEAYDGDLSEAEGSYTLGDYVIKAGETSAVCNITFNTSKLKDPSAFTQRDGHLHLRMKANDQFSEGTENMRTLTIVLKNYLSKPDDWDTATYPYLAISRYFGDYSRVKYQFMIQELNLVDFHVSYSATISYDEETNTISSNYASYLASRMKLALEEYNASHDTPLTDETGNVISF